MCDSPTSSGLLLGKVEIGWNCTHLLAAGHDIQNFREESRHWKIFLEMSTPTSLLASEGVPEKFKSDYLRFTENSQCNILFERLRLFVL